MTGAVVKESFISLYSVSYIILNFKAVKKYFWGVIPALAVIALYSMSNAGHKVNGYLGDADAIGTEADANERMNYEWQMLRDPATGKIPAHVRDRELAYAATLPGDGIFNVLGKTTAVSWDMRGPWNVGGRTRAMAIDASNENILLAGSCSGGMWRSADQGATWTKTSTQTQPLSVSCITQDTRAGHTNTWYYGSGEAYGASAGATGAYYLGNGIYKSTDSGLTWHVLPSTTTASLVTFDAWADLMWNIAIDPSNTTQDEVYAATYGGIYRSVDGGTTWNISKASSNSYFADIAVTPTGVVYATLSSDGAAKGIYRSTDGTSWTNITPAGFPATYNRVKIGICPDDETQVYFVGNTPGSGTPDTNYVGDVEWNSMWKYNYLSGDGTGAGGLWNDLSSNLPTSGGTFDKFTTQGSYDIVVNVKPGDTNTVFIGGTCLYRSTSAFKDNTHTRFIGGYKEGATLPVVDMYLNHHPDQHELVFLPSNPNKMISTNDGGIFMTNDNTASTVAWNSLNNGYITTMFYTCAIDHATTNDIIIGGAQDNGSWYTNSTSLTAPWVTPRGGDGSYCAIADNGGAYYFSIQSGKIMKAKLNSSGGVDSFARIDPIGINTKDYLFINPYVLDPNNNNIMYMAGAKYLWRNNDLSGIPYASNWDSIATNWTKFTDSVPTAGAKISCIAVSKNPANRVYYGTSSRRVYRIDNANSGTPTPTDITSTTTGVAFPTNGYVSSIAVDPDNADHIMVSFSNYSIYSIFYSADGGATWAKAAGNLETTTNGTGEGPSIRWVSIMPVAGGTVYLAGTSVGLFATTELKGTSTVWYQQGASTIGNAVVDMMDYRQTDGLVVVATHSHGIYSGHITQVADINSVSQLYTTSNPTFTAYPNPFSGQATISYELPQNNYVSLKVYDMTGRLVRILVDGQQSAGTKQITLVRSGFAPGVYLCTLQTGDKKATRQIVVQ
jgi:hypothetical protein